MKRSACATARILTTDDEHAAREHGTDETAEAFERFFFRRWLSRLREITNPSGLPWEGNSILVVMVALNTVRLLATDSMSMVDGLISVRSPNRHW
jgi:hypothetical protein